MNNNKPRIVSLLATKHNDKLTYDEQKLFVAMCDHNYDKVRDILSKEVVRINQNIFAHDYNNFLQMYVLNNNGYIDLEILRIMVAAGINLTNENGNNLQVISMIKSFKNGTDMKKIIDILLTSECDINNYNYNCRVSSSILTNLVNHYYTVIYSVVRFDQSFGSDLADVLILLIMQGAFINLENKQGLSCRELMQMYQEYLNRHDYKDVAFSFFSSMFEKIVLEYTSIQEPILTWVQQHKTKVNTYLLGTVHNLTVFMKRKYLMQYVYALHAFYEKRRADREEHMIVTVVPLQNISNVTMVFANNRLIAHVIEFI